MIGNVEAVDSYLKAADVGLNPIESGSGSNIKLAEYCGAGLAVVTTPFGLRGFEPLAGSVSVCPIPGFAEAIKQATWPNILGAEALVPYSWRAAAEPLEKLLE